MSKLKFKLNKPIVMVGLMGAGKTSIGRMLARQLELPFVDSDTEIEDAAGCSVIDIYSLYGEKEFRRGEEKVIQRLLSDTRLKILSTGEGGFIHPEIRQMIKKQAISIWLKADLDLLIKRTSLKNTRPLLLNHNSEEILEKLIQQRYPIYAKADITVETKDEQTYKTVNKVIEALEKYFS